MESSEVRSSSWIATLAPGVALVIRSAAALPFSRLRTARTTCAPFAASPSALHSPRMLALGVVCGRGPVAEACVGAGDDGGATGLVGNVGSGPLAHENLLQSVKR